MECQNIAPMFLFTWCVHFRMLLLNMPICSKIILKFSKVVYQGNSKDNVKIQPVIVCIALLTLEYNFFFSLLRFLGVHESNEWKCNLKREGWGANVCRKKFIIDNLNVEFKLKLGQLGSYFGK